MIRKIILAILVIIIIVAVIVLVLPSKQSTNLGETNNQSVQENNKTESQTEIQNQNEGLDNPTNELTPEALQNENSPITELTPEELQTEILQPPADESGENNEENAGSFKISSAKGIYPKFISGYIYPPKPARNSDQKISIKIGDPSGIKKVTLEIKDEYGGKTIEILEMKLAVGDAVKGDWVASWQPHDFENVIRWVFNVENNDGKTDDLTYFTTTK